MDVRFTWPEAKRESNRAKHGMNFADVERVFMGAIFTFEDSRFCYSERRFITLGLLHETPVCVEYAEEIHIVSFRKATRGEAKIYFEEVRD
jgi:uncharacterized DUF497 family protein